MSEAHLERARDGLAKAAMGAARQGEGGEAQAASAENVRLIVARYLRDGEEYEEEEADRDDDEWTIEGGGREREG